MRKSIAAMALAALVLAAPEAFAFGGGGGGGGRGGGGGGPALSGGGGGTTVGGGTVSASEPITALALGIGLLGAGYLRRRQ